jgi:NAD(P)H-quinone oxidoreductase subunit 5
MELNPALLLLLPVPMLPLLAGVLCCRSPERLAGSMAVFAALGSLLMSMVLVGVVLTAGPTEARLLSWGPQPISLRVDGVAVTMAILVSFLGLSVIRFSRRYLFGDPRQSQFYSWMSLTLGAVLTLVLSGNLLLIWVSWVAMSLSLHRLLLHFPQRTGAVFSARKKFVVSRLGDLCLLAAVVWVHRRYGTWDLDKLFQAASAGQTEGLPLICGLLAACAALKSAQFPFHSWLPDTMETPTPVSAFMHAGIINAGGFLVIRLSPLFVQAPGSLWALAIIGSLTAGFGAVVMLAQPTVKRALAYSTIAQMGFMMLECGLGAFGLALIHIVAHSLYKAHAFLHAGSSIGSSPRTAIALKTSGLAVGALVSVILVGGGFALLDRVFPTVALPSGLLAIPLGLAITYGLARIGSGAGAWRALHRGLPAAVGFTALALLLHAVSARLPLGKLLSEPPWPVALFVAAVFVGLFLFQVLLWRFRTLPFGRWFYVHALNGFYVGTYANRMLSRLWPKSSVP